MSYIEGMQTASCQEADENHSSIPSKRLQRKSVTLLTDTKLIPTLLLNQMRKDEEETRIALCEDPEGLLPTTRTRSISLSNSEENAHNNTFLTKLFDWLSVSWHATNPHSSHDDSSLTPEENSTDIALHGHLFSAEINDLLHALETTLLREQWDPNGNDYQKLLQSALRMAHSAKSGDTTALRHLSLLLFVADRYSHKLQLIVNSSCDKKLLVAIHSLFEDAIIKAKRRLDVLKRKHLDVPLQPYDTAIKTQLPTEIAELLWTKDCFCNSELIPLLLEAFDIGKEKPLNYEMNLLRNLQYLHDPICKNNIASIGLPSSPRSPADCIIRAVLGLKPGQEIERRHVCVAASSALLSHLRQGNAGSCFATFLAIHLLVDNPERTTQDFSALLHGNVLLRTCNGEDTEFPYLLGNNSQNLQRQVDIDSSGAIAHSSPPAYIWQAPGITAAAKLLGIEDPSIPLRLWIAGKFASSPTSSKKNTHLCRAEELLRALASHAHANLAEGEEQSLNQLFAKAYLGFETQTGHPLLYAWEYTIANMAEGESKGMIKSIALIASVNAVGQGFKDSKIPTPIRKLFLFNMKEKLNKRAKILYDPLIGAQQARDEHSNKGGFVLYDSNDLNKSRLWKRISTPEAYCSFLQEIAKQTVDEIELALCNQAHPHLHELRERIHGWIASPSFLESCLEFYSHRNPNVKEVLKEIDTLQHTPWIERDGEDSKRILDIYWQDQQATTGERIYPASAEQLLDKVISVSRQREKEGDTNTLMPIRAPGKHSFSMILQLPILRENQRSDAQWIEQELLLPGRSIASEPLSKDNKTALIKQISIEFLSKELLAKTALAKFFQHIWQLPQELSTAEWRHHVLKIMQKIDNRPPNLQTQRQLQLDTAIYELLPEEKRVCLERHLLHFADTNWQDGVHDIHFCFTINPGNGQLEMWECRDDGTHLNALDQKSWLEKQPWEFFTHLPKK